VADVEQRVTDRAGVPVDDRRQPHGPVVGDHDVEGAVVAVHDRGRAHLGLVGLEPLAEERLLRDLADPVAVELAEPARHLAVEEALRLAEALEPAGTPVDLLQLDEAVDVGHAELVQRLGVVGHPRR
jgi:hypothetical protein